MAPKKRRLSSLIESQLPGFIQYEYENFSKFVEKYYEHQESAGQPIDIISNLGKYRDIDTYEKHLLDQSTTLVSNIAADANTLELTDATSFPEENGYIKIGDEILFYQSRTGNVLEEVSRGVSGNTTLGDLYHSSTFVTTAAAPHYQSDVVYNVSNLFLYALVKEFEKTYLSTFPEAYLKEEVDKRLLIKNITKFYKSKGTDRSVKFIFNSIISKESDDIPVVVSPKDSTLKASTSDWSRDFYLAVKVVNGNAEDLVGQVITQNLDPFNSDITFASAVVDNVTYVGNDEFDGYYKVILEKSSVNGEFAVSGRTKTTLSLTAQATTDDRITVKSTMGFPKSGKLLIGDEVIIYKDKTVNQFIISERLGPIRNHSADKNVYTYVDITSSSVRLISLGLIYNLSPVAAAPYSAAGERIQISEPGFETLDPIIYDLENKRNRWLVNTSGSLASVKSVTQNFTSDVSAVFEDEQYYYIASSSLPSQDVLVDTTYSETVSDQKNLKIIRKQPSTTTEVYKTSNRDVGVFIDGVPAIGYKDSEFLKYGSIETVTVTNKGNSYAAAPFVLVNERTNLARCTLSGATVDQIEILTSEVFEEDPTIRITSGEGAVLKAVVTKGVITSMDVIDEGRFYSSPPIIRIVDNLGKGAFAEYEAILTPDGKIDEARKISGGRFYTSGQVNVVVEAVGRNAAATCEIKKWVYDRYNRFKNNLDSNNGTILSNYNPGKGFGYGYIANPDKLRERSYSSPLEYSQNKSNITKKHSPILGFAFDGNPIYGPYGYSVPTNSVSTVQKLNTGYRLNSTRPNGPDTGRYPLGTFIDDYTWTPSVNSGKTELDQNNGRYCVTPEYPDGTYAYFITIDSNEVPQFPYILGDNFYSLPVDSNYNSDISQDDIPLGVKALRTTVSEQNGGAFFGSIKDVKSGNISSAYIENTRNFFSPGGDVFTEDSGTGGFGTVVKVDQVTGKTVETIESQETKAVKISTVQPAYFFEGDEIVQTDSDGISFVGGEVIGDVINENTFVLRNVSGASDFKIESGSTIQSETLVQRVVLDIDASFTIGSTIRLTNDDDEDVASGVILETTTRQNSLIIKVDKVNNVNVPFYATTDYYLRSSTLSDTNRAEIIAVNSLSSGLEPFEINDNIAIVETDGEHNLGIGDKVNIDILPDDANTTTTYYVRKRLYQKATVLAPSHSSVVEDKGIGSADVLNTGLEYTSETYTDVELIFQDSNLARPNIGKLGDSGNAKATIVVSSPGGLGSGTVSSITITDKGSGYRTGDVLTVRDSDLARSTTATSSQRLTLQVDHVGLAAANTIVYLSNVNNLSQGDLVQIGPEIMKITGVDTAQKTITVDRGQENTVPTNHYDRATVSLVNPFYRFDNDFRPFGEGVTKPYLLDYDSSTQEIFVGYDYNVANPQKISQSTSFFDNSVPRKLVQMRSVQDAAYNLEFSTDNTNFSVNPVIDIQKYYRYTFDVSHVSMADTYLDFSASANQNIFTEEKEVSNISPGSIGAFVTIKLGFGPAISTNNYQTQQQINYQNYFYFIKVSPDVDTSNSYLRIINDPLSGVNTVNYVTPTRFVYSMTETPSYDGSGTMSYVTSSRAAVGGLVNLNIVNSGESYNLLPTVKGVSMSSEFEANVEATYDEINQTVVGFNIIDGGSNYSKPVAVVIDGDGTGYEYECDVQAGKVSSVRIIKQGEGFTYQPLVKIIESDVTIYLESSNIGLPKNIQISNPGRGFNSDESLLSTYKSPTTFILRNISDKFFFGEKIVQDVTGATAIVSENGFREGSNLLKVSSVSGVFKNGEEIKSAIGSRTATLYAQVSTEFDPEIKSYVDNFGFFTSDRGKLSNNNQRLQDSYFYQDYSYVLKSKTSIEVWRDLIKETTHPAGFQLFGEMVVDSKAEAPMPTSQPALNYISVVELPPVSVTVLQDEPDTYKRNTVTVISTRVQDLVLEDGIGSVSVDTFDTTETNTYNVSLTPAFDGRFDPNTGQVIGNKTFTLVDQASGNALTLSQSEQLFITLDGIIQEPGVAFTVNGSSITFAQAPFGDRVIEGQDVYAVRFSGRAIKFKNPTLNTRYFRKIKNIADQFDGVQFEFDLYWENNTIVKTDPNENLIVALNGVVQKARGNETEPFGNSYSIIRSEDASVGDKIRFSKPPIDNEDLYGPPEQLPEELKAYEKCFIYTIGSYQRLKVNSRLYEYRFAGPYLIQDEISNEIRKIDDSSYALVFIDGVLQQEGRSYQIVGPNITFAEPLKAYEDASGIRVTQDVNIILMYGRDVPRTLTFYEFEPGTFNNTLTVTLEGTGISQSIIDVYDVRSVNPRVYFTQGSTLVGKINRYSVLSDDKIVIDFTNPLNVELDSDTPITINDLDHLYTGNYYSAVIPGTYTISYEYKKDDDGDRVLERTVPQWLYGLVAGNKAWNNKNSMFANLIPGDRILIDGESEFRTVTGTPDTAKLMNYRTGDVVQSDIYAKASVTDYNGDTQGVGLSLTANISGGAVQTLNVADVEWNQRDLQLYFEQDILLQPTAYEYFTTPEVHFIPVDGNGGGAKAEVIAYGGQILDVVLTEGGSGYTQPPKVVVARRFKRIKENSRKVDTLVKLGVQSIRGLGSPITSVSEIIISGDGDTNAIFSLVTFGAAGSIVVDDEEGRRITTGIHTLAGEERQVLMTDEKFPTEARVQSPVPILPQITDHVVDRVITQVVGGVVGFEIDNTIKTIEVEELKCIIQIPARKSWVPVGLPSVNGYGTFLDAPLAQVINAPDDYREIVYVANTSRFPDTPSRLRIGRELLFYREKQEDRFLGVSRGWLGTPADTHQAGELVLHEPEFVTLLSGGVTEIYTEVSVSSAQTATRESTVTIQSISNVEIVENEITHVDETERELQVVLDKVDYGVIEQITIIPPTSYNVVTDVHSTQTRITFVNATVEDVFGIVGEVGQVKVNDIEIQLTQQNQIELDTEAIISSVTIGNVAATVSSTSHVVTTSALPVILTNQVQVETLTSMESITTTILENVHSTVFTLGSIISTFKSYDASSRRVAEISSEIEPQVLRNNVTEITTTIGDIDTFVTTFSLLVGGGIGDGGSSIEVPYKFAVIDYIIEEYVLEQNVKKRDNTYVLLADPYNEVIRRDGSIFLVENRNQNVPPGFEDYTVGNVGLTLGSFESNALVDSGISSGLTLADVDAIYPTLSIRDFDFREDSALLSNGDRFNIGIPSYQQPVTISQATGTIGGSIVVVSTDYFADSGYLFTSSGNVIQYTSKSATSFDNCTLIRGANAITAGDDVIPFSIV